MIAEFETKEEEQAYFGSFYRYKLWSMRMIRDWWPLLTNSQRIVLTFVFDRTIGWRKRWEQVTLHHLTHGVESEDGKEWIGGTGLSKPTLIEAMRGLRDMGLILDRWNPQRQRNEICIELEWNLVEGETIETSRHMGGLPEPKRGHRGGRGAGNFANRAKPGRGEGEVPEGGEGVKKPYPAGVKKLYPNNKKGKNHRLNATHSTGSPGEGEAPGTEGETPADADAAPAAALADVAASALARTRERREAKKGKGGAAGIAAVWDDAVRAALPDAPRVAVTKADVAILGKYARRFAAANPATPFAEYVGWCVGWWAVIRAQEFGWMRDGGPELPSIRFLVKFSDRFEQCHAHRAALEQRAAMTARELEIDRRVRRGQTRDAAELEVDKVDALRREQRKLEDARRALAQERRMGEAASARRAEAERRKAELRERRERIDVARRRAAESPDPSGAGGFGTWD